MSSSIRGRDVGRTRRDCGSLFESHEVVNYRLLEHALVRSKQNRLGSQLQRLGVAALPDAMPVQTRRVVRALAFGVQDVSVSGLLAAPPSP